MEKRVSLANIISGTLLIAGTTIGAGMLGIPLVTARAGFLPASLITIAVWLFMLATGFLFLEATLWMHHGANVLSITKKFLGNNGRLMAGGVFLFLYYCLMVAYFAAGGPILAAYIEDFSGIVLEGWTRFFVFGVLFGIIVGIGLKFVDRVNYILMIGLLVAFAALLSVGAPSIRAERLLGGSWSYMFLSAPILFSAFGYHNVIPSLTHHFKDNGRIMRKAIIFGTLIPLVIYLLWQWLIIGALPLEFAQKALVEGQPVTEALEKMAGASWIPVVGRLFGMFAIVTSMLGVSFSMVDFLGDGLNWERKGMTRFILCVMTFVPPFIFAALDPSIFVLAISVAGGYGEAFLNGFLPAWLVWVGRYHKKRVSQYALCGGKPVLLLLLFLACAVMVLETLFLLGVGR